MNQIIWLFIKCVIVLTITTKIGFVIQGTYFDLKGVALACFIGLLSAFATLGLSIIGLIISYIIYTRLLCRIGMVEMVPDTFLATIIGCAGFAFVMVDIIKNTGVLEIFLL